VSDSIFRPNSITKLFSTGIHTSMNMIEKTLDILNILGNNNLNVKLGLRTYPLIALGFLQVIILSILPDNKTY